MNVSLLPASETTRGYAAAVSAYLMWGLIAPVYFKAVGAAGPAEIMAHRVLWTVVVMGLLVGLVRSRADVRAVIDSPRKLWVFLLTTTLVTANWSIFVWAISQSRLVEASLGYFINPLVNVALGVAFLHEKLTRGQALAVAVAGVGVGAQVVEAGVFPWLPICLALSFGFYALVRKKEGVDPLTGLLVETVLLIPLALGYLLWLGDAGQFLGAAGDGVTGWLLILAGPMTAAPLALFMYAGRRLTLSTLGLLQYIGPTGQLLLGVLAFGEAFTAADAAAFACVWLALAIYTADAWARRRAAAKAAA